MKPSVSLSGAASALDAPPLSLLNDLLYCSRRAALKAVEGWRAANEHTARGDIVHEHADLSGYEVAKGVRVLRALPVWSDRLGLSGKCDVVEVQSLKSKVQSPKLSQRLLTSAATPGWCRSNIRRGSGGRLRMMMRSFARRGFAWRRCSA